MPKAAEVAAELRRIADAFEQTPETQVPFSYISFVCREDRQSFLALAKVWPRPFKKRYPYKDHANLSELELVHGSARLSVSRSALCRLVEPPKPAVYECEPLLSLEEEAAL